MLRPALAMICALSMVTGCEGSAGDECEKALVVVAAHIDKELANSETEEVKRAVRNMQAETNKYFVSECTKLDDKAKACLPRMQEFLAKGSVVDEKYADCVRPGSGEEPECEAKMVKELEAIMGECGPPMDELQRAIAKRGMPDWRAKQAAEKAAEKAAE